MYKKIAIATLIAAPVLVQVAAHFMPGAATPPAVETKETAPTPPTASAKPAAPAPITYSAIPQAQDLTAAAMDTTPSLDPNLQSTSGAAAPPTAASANVQPAPQIQAAPLLPPPVNPIGTPTPTEVRHPRF